MNQNNVRVAMRCDASLPHPLPRLSPRLTKSHIMAAVGVTLLCDFAPPIWLALIFAIPVSLIDGFKASFLACTQRVDGHAGGWNGIMESFISSRSSAVLSCRCRWR